MRLLSLLLAGVVLGAPDEPPVPAPSPPPAPVAELLVRAGRATVVQGETFRTYPRSTKTVPLTGPAFLECGPGADVEVMWRGLSSVRLRGSGAIEWEVAEATPEEPTVRVQRLTTVDLEARRGIIHLELPEGWAMKPQAAALRLVQRPGEEIEVRHHGGRTVRIISRVPRPDPSWPRRIESGGRAMLPALPPAPTPRD